MMSFTKTLRENFYNVDVVYPHEYEDEEYMVKYLMLKRNIIFMIFL